MLALTFSPISNAATSPQILLVALQTKFNKNDSHYIHQWEKSKCFIRAVEKLMGFE
jgi:hypothetical protein